MCGIVGVVGRIGKVEKKIFRDLLYIDVIRGDDSTGIFSVNKDGVVFSDKEVGTPEQLLKTSIGVDKEELVKGNLTVLVGHNRAATKGVVNRDNAHPFEFDNFIGVKNGSLHSTYRLDDPTNHPVDSYKLMSHMNKHGVVDGWAKKGGGGVALVMYSKKDKNLQFIRNKDRPLFFVKSEDKKTTIFASEPWMITSACDTHGYKLHLKSKKKIQLWYFNEDTHYICSLNGTIKSTQKLESTSSVYNGFVNNQVANVNHKHPKPLRTEDLTKLRSEMERRGHWKREVKKPDTTPFRTKSGKVTWDSNTNLGWAYDSAKADKGTRGLSLRITSFRITPHNNKSGPSNTRYFVGKIIDKGIYKNSTIYIYPPTRDHWETLHKSFDNREVLQTHSRCRLLTGTNADVFKLGISGSCVLTHKKSKAWGKLEGDELREALLKHRFPDLFKTSPKEEPEKSDEGYNIYLMTGASKKQWTEAVELAGKSCSGCGDPLIEEDHKDYYWRAKDQCFCKSCAEFELNYQPMMGY